MSTCIAQPKYSGMDGDSAQSAVFTDSSGSRIFIHVVDAVSDERAVIAMTADQAEAFARDLLDTAMSLQKEQADD